MITNKSLKVIRKSIDSITEKERIQIDELIENNGGTVFHETKLNIIASDVFKTKLTYFLAYQNNELAGICPCHSVKDRFLILTFSNLSSYEIPYGGWIYNKDVSIKELLQKTKINQNEALIYSSNIQLDKNEYECINNLKPFLHNTLILKLSLPIDEIFNSGINHKLRNKILRASKLGVTIEKIQSNNMNEFFNLSDELKNKIGLKQRDFNYYHSVMREYEKVGKAICLAAKYNDKFVSAMILIANKNFSIAWVAGRKVDLPNNLYQNELLWWESILWSHNIGCKYFDLCGLDETNLPHIARIKLSFSKEIVPFYIFSQKSFIYNLINKTHKILGKY